MSSHHTPKESGTPPRGLRAVGVFYARRLLWGTALRRLPQALWDRKGPGAKSLVLAVLKADGDAAP